MSIKLKFLIGFILILIGFILGYLTHNWIKPDLKSLDVKVDTIYVRSGSIKGSFTNLEPISFEFPSLTQTYPSLYYKSDTIRADSLIYVIQSIDTTAVLEDYVKRYHYEVPIFDIDTVGSCYITAETQFNRLELLSYKFNPIQKLVQTTTRDVWHYQPYVGVGLGTQSTYNISAGIFIDHIGLGYQYYGTFNNVHSSHMINLSYKFNLK